MSAPISDRTFKTTDSVQMDGTVIVINATTNKGKKKFFVYCILVIIQHYLSFYKSHSNFIKQPSCQTGYAHERTNLQLY